jgi:hypothetical protein
MNGSLITIGAAVFLILCASAIAFARERTASACLQLIGSVFLTIMVLTHFAEAFHLFPQMGWGLPHTAGHYIDFMSAWGGVALLALGYFRRKLRRRI